MSPLTEFCFFMAIFVTLARMRRDSERLREQVDRLMETPPTDTGSR